MMRKDLFVLNDTIQGPRESMLKAYCMYPPPHTGTQRKHAQILLQRV
jgi:hypothetical protein